MSTRIGGDGRTRSRAAGAWLTGVAALIAAAPLSAQFDPGRVATESPAVAARFAPLKVDADTPGLRAGRTDFASHSEAIEFLEALAAQPSTAAIVRLEMLGQSQQGRPIPLVRLARPPSPGDNRPRRPSVLVIAQQHGNEPASGEAALALVARLAGPQAGLLDRVDVAVIARGNPDGADAFRRTTASGIDVNRDHLLLGTPEGRAIATALDRLKPDVIVDLHEFTVAGRWVEKFGVVMKHDALVQPATVGNLDPALAAWVQRSFVERLHAAWKAAGMSSFAYHTTGSDDPSSKVVSMGGVQPDTGRNVGGLRPAVSLLIEGRGVGIGRAHYPRRVQVLALGVLAVVQAAADEGDDLVARVDAARQAVRRLACRETLVIDATHSPGRQRLEFLDAVTGEDREIEVDWRAAVPLEVRRARSRPCGYLLGADQATALERLRLLGVETRLVTQGGTWSVERYVVQEEAAGQRQDARGAIRDAAAIRRLQVRTEAATERVAAGTVYVPLDQPLSGLISAALEPDSQNSYVANRLLALDGAALRRVVMPPPPDVLGR